MGCSGGSLGGRGGLLGRSRGRFGVPEVILTRGQIHTFVRFLACPLCGFDAVLGCSLAFLGGSWDPSGAPKVALGASRGVPRERVPPPGGSRGAPETENQRFEAMVILP